MIARRDVFQAIADPTRREIIAVIASKSQNLNTIADQFKMSRQAVSIHIKILSECGLVIIKQQGRERFCEARLGKLKEVSSWVEQYHRFWQQQFDSLDNYIKEVRAKSPSTLTTKSDSTVNTKGDSPINSKRISKSESIIKSKSNSKSHSPINSKDNLKTKSKKKSK